MEQNMKAGDKLITACPIQLSEYEDWPEGTLVEVEMVRENGDDIKPAFGPNSYEIGGPNGTIGSFSDCDAELFRTLS
jgi:hypothetical protein